MRDRIIGLIRKTDSTISAARGDLLTTLEEWGYKPGAYLRDTRGDIFQLISISWYSCFVRMRLKGKKQLGTRRLRRCDIENFTVITEEEALS